MEFEALQLLEFWDAALALWREVEGDEGRLRGVEGCGGGWRDVEGGEGRLRGWRDVEEYRS